MNHIKKTMSLIEKRLNAFYEMVDYFDKHEVMHRLEFKEIIRKH